MSNNRQTLHLQNDISVKFDLPQCIWIYNSSLKHFTVSYVVGPLWSATLAVLLGTCYVWKFCIVFHKTWATNCRVVTENHWHILGWLFLLAVMATLVALCDTSILLHSNKDEREWWNESNQTDVGSNAGCIWGPLDLKCNDTQIWPVLRGGGNKMATSYQTTEAKRKETHWCFEYGRSN